MDKRAVTVEQAADLLSLSRDSVYDLVNAGQLTLLHFGRRKRASRIAVCEIDQLLAEQIERARRRSLWPDQEDVETAREALSRERTDDANTR